MDRVKLKYDQLLQALKSLEDVMLFSQDIVVSDEKVKNTLRLICADSQIQRFEYCFEEFWGFFQLYLERIHGVVVVSSRSAAREIYTLGFLTDDELVLFLQMVDDRNRTSHGYRCFIATKVYEQIPAYFQFMKSCVHRFTFE